MPLLDNLGGAGLLPFDQRWNPVGQLMTPADPNMQAALMRYGQGLLNPPPQQPPPLPPPQDVPGRAFAAALPTDQPPPQNAPAASPGAPDPGIFGGLSNAISRNPLTLMALGGGIMRGGLGLGLQQAAPMAMQERQQQMAAAGRQATYQALRARGFSDADALAAMANPQMGRAAGQALFHQGGRSSNAKFGPIGPKDENGRQPYGWIDSENQTITPYNPPGASGDGQTSALDRLKALYGNDYAQALDEIDPKRAEMMRKVADGTFPFPSPTFMRSDKGLQLMDDLAHYEPDSDATKFPGRRKMVVDLNSSGPSSMGGIVSNGKSAFGHLAQLSDNFVSLGNYSGPDVPGGALAGQAGNVVGNYVLARPQTKGALESVRDNSIKYGQESTKFYSATGGGEQERLAALKGAGSPSALATEQAAFLETEKGLMLTRMREKEAQIRSQMGDRWADNHPVEDDEFRKSVAKIDSNIARLRGQPVPGTGASTAADPLGIR